MAQVGAAGSWGEAPPREMGEEVPVGAGAAPWRLAGQSPPWSLATEAWQGVAWAWITPALHS